jgi:hypothetical protein
MADDTMQLIASNIAGDLAQLADEIVRTAKPYRDHAEVDSLGYKPFSSEWRAATSEFADFDVLLDVAKQLRKIAHGVERTGLEPAGTASGGTYRPARCSCGSAGSRGTVESDSTTDATAGLDRGES